MRTHGLPRCEGCQKNPRICICGRITPRETPHRLLIYQHPIEVWRASNTALLITRLYPTAKLVLRGDPDGEAEIDRLLAEPGCKPYVVFPEPGAPEAGEVAKAGWSEGERPLFILIDGSWRQARRMRRRLKTAHPMATVRLAPEHMSAYRVRRQVREGNVCTAEAAALLLGRLDGLEGPDPHLTELFLEWIDEILIIRGLLQPHERTVYNALNPKGPYPPRPKEKSDDLEDPAWDPWSSDPETDAL